MGFLKKLFGLEKSNTSSAKYTEAELRKELAEQQREMREFDREMEKQMREEAKNTPQRKRMKAHLANEITDADVINKAYVRRLNVVGTQYDNPDGTSRQELLDKLYKRESPFKGKLTIDFEEFVYEDAPAFYVLVNKQRIGVVPADMVNFVKNSRDRFAGIDDFYVDPPTTYSNRESAPYYATIRLLVIKK